MSQTTNSQAAPSTENGARPFRVATIQTVSTPHVAENLAIAGELLAEAAACGAELAVLPEYFPIMGRRDADKVAVREPYGEGPIQRFLAEAARRHGLWLVGGSIPLEAASPDKVLNACLVFDPQGRHVARYDKIHLFGFEKGAERYNESATIEPGRDVVVADTALGRIGLSICYDIRFPELYRAMGPLTAFVLPAAFTATTGRAHWELLIRARAVENQCYAIASAQGGQHPNGRETWGESMIVDPWGEVLARLPKGPGVITAEIDPARISEVRTSLPALRHRVL